MQIIDLGAFSGEVILWGGALGNLAALRALAARVDDRAPDAVICTGDLAGYCADGAACAELVAARSWPVVAGNVERALASASGSCGCGFEPGSACDRLSVAWWRHACETVGPAQRLWMAGLPDIAVFRHGARRYAVVHGGATDIARFLWPVSRQAEFAQEIAAIEALTGPVDGVIAGHAGVAFQRVVAGRHWINAGAIGLPANKGIRGGQYVRLDAAGAHILRLSYDPAPSVAAMVGAGLVQGYERALETGRWPSQDILPPEMRRAEPVS